MNIDSEFPARYWLNLGRNQERRFATEGMLESTGITARRFRAVDARFVRKSRGYESVECYVHALTQRLAVRKAMLAGAKAVLLFGDNVMFHPDIKAKLEGIELPDNWGIFLLGCTHLERPLPQADGIVKVTKGIGSYAIAVRAPYYKEVLAALKAKTDACPCHVRGSGFLLDDLQEHIPTYACYPDLAWETEPVHSPPPRGNNLDGDEETKKPADAMAGFQAEVWGGSRWNEVEETSAEHPSPKLGLLFLTRGSVNHPKIWEEFLANANGEVAAFAHVKDPNDAGILANYLIGEQHDTQWGDISLVHAMSALLRAGLADPTLTHFAFVSENCIPVKPWREMRRQLMIDPRSTMDLEDSKSMRQKHLKRLKSVKGLPENTMFKHSQWVLLDREAASCVIEYDFTKHFAHIEAPDEHYFGTVLAMRGFPIDKRVRVSPLTWVKWKTWPLTTPVCHTEVSSSLAMELATFSGFFARKFPAESEIGKWGLHGPAGA